MVGVLSRWSASSLDLIAIPENPVPEGAIMSAVRARDGADLRVARWVTEGSRGTVALLTGRAEFIEKYFEVIGELLARGFDVVAMDWRGQGLSVRELANPRKGHIDDFAIYERDLDSLTQQILVPFCPRPWFGLGHSMGAAILIAQSQSGQSPFDRLVLTAPMIDLCRLPFRRWAPLLAEGLDIIGLGGAFVPGGRASSILSGPFAGNPLTSDPRRFARTAAIAKAAPQLTVGDPTIGWANAAFRLMRQFTDADYPRRTPTPTLIFAAGGDRVVSTPAIERFASRLKVGRFLTIPAAEHEILMERDPIRELFWAGFDAFIPGTALAPAPEAAPGKSRRFWWRGKAKTPKAAAEASAARFSPMP